MNIYQAETTFTDIHKTYPKSSANFDVHSYLPYVDIVPYIKFKWQNLMYIKFCNSFKWTDIKLNLVQSIPRHP